MSKCIFDNPDAAHDIHDLAVVFLAKDEFLYGRGRL